MTADPAVSRVIREAHTDGPGHFTWGQCPVRLSITKLALPHVEDEDRHPDRCSWCGERAVRAAGGDQ